MTAELLDELRPAVDVACVAPGPRLVERLARLRAEVTAAVAVDTVLSPLGRSTAEDLVADWLVAAGVKEGPDLRRSSMPATGRRSWIA